MIQTRSLSRELALLLLEQISDENIESLEVLSLDKILNKAIDTLMHYWREELDNCSNLIELAQDDLIGDEDNELRSMQNNKTKDYLKKCLNKEELILNNLSDSIELVRIIALSDHIQIRKEALKRVKLIKNNFNNIDDKLNNVMEGWRLGRLPKIDRDILRIAFVELNYLNIPIAVACNEAVNLANKYSDEQGRKMINGILRRLQDNLFLVKK
tara:strand:+ start:1371 stop:2009 length:639 start_codon:yes stop_codon:yes gene_type:complete